MNANEIGKNAGIVWRTLENERLSWETLVKATGLKPLELASAIGWLARENKIHIDAENGILFFSVQQMWYF